MPRGGPVHPSDNPVIPLCLSLPQCLIFSLHRRRHSIGRYSPAVLVPVAAGIADLVAAKSRYACLSQSAVRLLNRPTLF
jgi:hypothetical protein